MAMMGREAVENGQTAIVKWASGRSMMGKQPLKNGQFMLCDRCLDITWQLSRYSVTVVTIFRDNCHTTWISGLRDWQEKGRGRQTVD